MELPPLTWKKFSKLFMVRFLPDSVRAHEFERLEETDGMSVSKYSAHFTQLSRYAPYHIIKDMCIKRFIVGLREYIFRSVVGSNCHTFADVLSLAFQIELRQKDKGGGRQNSHKKQQVDGSYSNYSNRGGGSMVGHQGQQKSVSQKGNFNRQSSGIVQSHKHSSGTTSACSVCGRFYSGTCSNDNGECFQCGQRGHIKKNCPTTQPSSSHASTPTTLATS
jgi:hypothetical protein